MLYYLKTSVLREENAFENLQPKNESFKVFLWRNFLDHLKTSLNICCEIARHLRNAYAAKYLSKFIGYNKKS